MGRKSIGEKITVGEYYALWIERKRKSPLIRVSALRDYEQHFKKNILPSFARERLADISIADLKVFRDLLLSSGLSVKTARNIMDGSFRALWREAMEEGWFERNPFLALRWPAMDRPPPDPFTEAEKSAILSYTEQSDPFYYPFVFVMFDTGMRPSESTALRWADINIGQLTFSISKSRHLYAENKTKTSASKREIIVSPEAMELAQAMRLPWHDQESHVFYNSNGDALDANNWARKYWPRICKGAGVRYRKFYATRHTFITLMIGERGEFPAAVAHYCGTSLEMIQKDYCGRLTLKSFQNGPKLLNSVLDPTGIEPVRQAIDNIKLAVNARFHK